MGSKEEGINAWDAIEKCKIISNDFFYFIVSSVIHQIITYYMLVYSILLLIFISFTTG